MSSMDFFGHQDRARAASGRLVWLFALAVLALAGCIYLVASVLFVVGNGGDGPIGFEPTLFVAVFGGTLGVVLLATLWKTAQLRSGGAAVAEMLGGTPVDLTPHDPHHQLLRNLVEEMAIASGLPVPAIYVLEGESGINAFAAGWSPGDAAIAVTRGCLEQLDRDELQGVIAHEFSHVFHGDMRLNIRLLGVLFGIVCIATIGRILLRATPRSGNRKDGAAGIAVFGLTLVVLGWLGVLFAHLIQAAVSRQREFLADASAVQYTRNPHGIGMALAKIGGLSARLDNPHADEASHLLFADGVKRFLGGVMATHPPLTTRIERLLPGFQRRLAAAPSLAAAVTATPPPPGAAGLAGSSPAAQPGVRATDLVASIGAPGQQAVSAAQTLLRELPLDLASAAHEPARARGVALALLLDGAPARREAQLRLVPSDDPGLQLAVRNAFPLVSQLTRGSKLPLLELTVPALRALPTTQRLQLRQLARSLALADGELSPFEFALLRGLERHVPGASPLPARAGRPTALIEHAAAASVVLSALAHAGAGADADAAQQAFAHGRTALALPVPIELLPPPHCGMQALERAIDELATVSPLGKRNLVTACAEAAAADGRLAADEVDLVRALAELWDCPVPLPADAS
jgi:Zn-dependent protease with chaperone function